MKKIRVDELLCQRGHCSEKDAAARLVMAGLVRTSPDCVVRKPSDLLPEDSPLFVENGLEYVSRGAYKLKDALKEFLPSLEGKVALDVGSSTGGFTDLMLQNGAKRVYASDVGKGLLHWRLRTDERVVCVEGVNARNLSAENVPEKIDVVTSDVSFISVTKVLAPANRLMKTGAMSFILVKPQFEADKRSVPHGGVVTDPAVHKQAVDKVVAFAEKELAWTLLGVRPSPIKGPKGNQEFVAVFRKNSREA